MSKQNRTLFDNYHEKHYFKENKAAEHLFKVLKLYPNALGFDEENHGFIVLHKKHKAGGIENEIEWCIILKKYGFGVELIEEYENEKCCDAKIEGKIFEIKVLKNAENVRRAISRHFQKSYLKTGNIILGIKLNIAENQLKSYLKEACEAYSSIKRVWLIYRNQLIQLDRMMILSKKFSK